MYNHSVIDWHIPSFTDTQTSHHRQRRSPHCYHVHNHPSIIRYNHPIIDWSTTILPLTVTQTSHHLLIVTLNNPNTDWYTTNPSLTDIHHWLVPKHHWQIYNSLIIDNAKPNLSFQIGRVGYRFILAPPHLFLFFKLLLLFWGCIAK